MLVLGEVEVVVVGLDLAEVVAQVVVEVVVLVVVEVVDLDLAEVAAQVVVEVVGLEQGLDLVEVEVLVEG